MRAMRKPHAARLVEAMEVDVNVYPPNRGWDPWRGPDLHELIGRALQELRADYEGRVSAESPPDSSDDEIGKA